MPLDQFADQRWAVAITLPRAERIAKRQFTEAGVEAFLPLRERPPTPERPLVVEPLWPGYLFICGAQIPKRRSGETLVRAASGLISTLDGNPILAPRGLVEGLIARADSDGLLERYEPPPPFEPKKGDAVRVKWGVLEGWFGIVNRIRGIKLELEFSCAIGQKPVWVRSEQVEAAA
jgi:transcription antitermination factor NusG